MEYNVYFSPTGGTKKAAKLLSPEGKVIDLSLRGYSDRTEFSEDDLVFISVPSFQGRVPEWTAKKIKECLRGNGALCVINACYGQRAYDDTLIELYDTVKELGFRTVAAVSSVTEHSMWREYAAGRPDEKDEEVLSSFREKILEKIAENDFSEPFIPGNRPYKETHPGMTPIWEKELCTSCGACALACPTSAIDIMDCGVTDTSLCMSCMRCTDLCPTV